MRRIRTESESETYDVGFKTAKNAVGGEIYTLSGELGAGKTVFAKGFAAGLGIEVSVTSPTFTIMNEYDGGRLRLYHYDAYRLKSGNEAIDAGLVEQMGDEEGVCLIEWAENIASVVPSYATKITIEYTGERSREIIIDEQ